MSNNAASNVIAMRDFDRPAASSQQTAVSTQQATQFDRLLRECEDLALVRLTVSVASMLDKAGDTLWGMAEQAQDREQREAFGKARDKIHEQRKVMEEHFRSNYLGEFQTRARRERQEHGGGTFAQFNLSSLELGLVNDEELEETLKVNDMAAKLRRYCEEELVALDQRIGVLVGDANLQGDANPFSPQAILAAFKLACRHVEESMRIRLVFLKLFDDHVLDDVRSIYRDLNALLVQRSILPKIRYTVNRRAATGPAAAVAAAAAAHLAGAQGDRAAAGDSAGSEQDFFAVLQGLMTNLAGAAPAAGPAMHIPGFPPILGAPSAAGTAGPAGAVRLLQGPELLGSLTRIQHGDVSAVSAGNLPLAATLADPGTVNVLRELKATSLAGGMGQMDIVTLDIVAMLFDQIFDDQKIPTTMKALIGRLQIPVLKVAILDKTFFSKKHHAAREFLDTLGEVALGLNADFDADTPLYKALDRIVQKLIDDFNDRIELFEELHGEVKRVVAEDNQRAEEEAARVAKAIEQKERLQVAKAVAQQEIRQRAKIHTIPQVVLKFLADHWVKLLLVAHAKHGPDSPAWKSALETTDLLIWSVTSKQNLEERRKLASRLPSLLKRLNYGMQLIHVEEQARKRFFAKLMRCHTKVINGTAASPRRQPAPPALSPAYPPLPAVLRPAEPPTLTDVAVPAPATEAPARVELPLPPAIEALLAPDLPALVAPGEPEPAPAPEIDEDTAPADAPPTFTAVTVQNPFGEGEIEVEEISLSDLPALAGTETENEPQTGDEHSQIASSLKEGRWVEFRDAEDNRTQAKLSYISPLKGTYLFISRQGRKVAEFSLYQLAREFRCGNAVVMDSVPLVDRAMSSLVGVLRMTSAAH